MVNNVLRKIKLDSKKIILALLVVVLLSLVVLKAISQNKVVLDNVILDINNSKDSLAIYIEKYDAEGNASYVESDNHTFPLDNYVYNKELSGCLDSNSNEVEDALRYDYTKKELNLRVNKPVTCYVYYDYKGNGTETVPYKIRSIEDLLDLSLNTTKGNNHTNEYFELTKDLDFQDTNSYNDSERTDYGELNGIDDDGNTLMNELTTGTGWVSIGNSSTNGFQGIFDGDNKKINNLYQKENVGGGLFGAINNATLKNLTLSGDVTSSNVSNVGGIVTITLGNTIIDNCHNEVNVTSLANGGSAGGIAGGSSGEKIVIKNSSNKGNISGSNNAGGLIGSYLYDLTVENSYNEGTITNALGGHAGGLIGRDDAAINMTTILNSYNAGKVLIDGNDRETYSGGLIGKLNGNAYVNNSYNNGNLETNIGQSTHQLSVGGLVGRSYGSLIITGFKNLGNITGGNRIGGISGMVVDSNSKTIIDKSYNAGTISPSSEEYWSSGIGIGGLIGVVYREASMYLLNSYNEGNLKCNSNKQSAGCGGLIESTYGTNSNQLGVILNSYNVGNISNGNFGSGIGNLTGERGTLKLNNVYNTGDFIDITTKHGIGQFNVQTYDVKKAYYKNNIEGSNITNNEIIGKDLNYMQSDAFVNDLNNNIDNINLSDYIDNDLLTKFETTTGYKLTLSKWKLKDSHPVLVDLEGM